MLRVWLVRIESVSRARLRSNNVCGVREPLFLASWSRGSILRCDVRLSGFSAVAETQCLYTHSSAELSHRDP